MNCQSLLSTTDEIECAESLLMLASVGQRSCISYNGSTEESGRDYDVKPLLLRPTSVIRASDTLNSSCEHSSEIVDMENYRQCFEMIRRIKLDHCYASTHLFGQRSVWREAQMSTSICNSLEDLHEYSLSPTAGVSDEDFYSRKRWSPSDLPDHNGQSGDDDSTDGEYVDCNSAPKWKQGEASKRRNFNALLECFKDDLESSDIKKQNRHYSKRVSRSLETSGNRSNWPQSFSKKRYMMKHMEDTLVNTGGSITYTSANNLNVQDRYNLYTKAEVGNLDHCAYVEDVGQARLDLCECQLCHIRLKRNLLVKHLASEHCVESSMVHKVNKQQSVVPVKGDKKLEQPNCQDKVDNSCSDYVALKDVADASMTISTSVSCKDEQRTIVQLSAVEDNASVVQSSTDCASRQNSECVENGGNGSNSEAVMSTDYLENIVYVADSHCAHNSFSSETLDHSYETLDQSSMYIDDSLSFDDDELYEEESDISDLMMPSCSVLGATSMGEIIHV